MSRPVQIILTLAVFVALMTGAGMILKPTIHAVDDWLVSQVGQIGAWGILLLAVVPFGLWGPWSSYQAGKATRT